MSRPILPWRSPLVIMPPPGSTVWIRRLPWYDVPVLATSMTPDAGFTLHIPTAPSGDLTTIVLPAAAVHTWKFRYLEDEQSAFPPS